MYRKGYSLLFIAKKLSDEGVAPPRAKAKGHRARFWRKSTLREMLGDRSYIGEWTYRHIAGERHTGSVLVAVGDMLADQAEQMPLPEHDDVVEQFSAQRADPPLGESVLPRRARRGPELLNA